MTESRQRVSTKTNTLCQNIKPTFFFQGSEDLINTRATSMEYLKLTETAVSPSVDNPQEHTRLKPESTPHSSNEVLASRTEENIENPKQSPTIDNSSESDNMCLLTDSKESGLNLQLDPHNPMTTSINLIQFSPNEPDEDSFSRTASNDKRKSSETESLEDENSIYQQVKYFRRSVHEINSLLESAKSEACAEKSSAETNTKGEIEEVNYDSLEIGDGHVYENVESSSTNTTVCLPEAGEVVTEPPEKINVRSLTSRFEAIETNHKPSTAK